MAIDKRLIVRKLYLIILKNFRSKILVMFYIKIIAKLDIITYQIESENKLRGKKKIWSDSLKRHSKNISLDLITFSFIINLLILFEISQNYTFLFFIPFLYM